MIILLLALIVFALLWPGALRTIIGVILILFLLTLAGVIQPEHVPPPDYARGSK